ncbi:unnamed protein product [Aphis gossypii]|uniref:Uncharacterized protein n=1 Tax=Aphis gossypii TaxID=80765 RepID=A0A9P0NQG8_APHGO|nr:unnamed protein product [Aphis gossypii]
MTTSERTSTRKTTYVSSRKVLAPLAVRCGRRSMGTFMPYVYIYICYIVIVVITLRRFSPFAFVVRPTDRQPPPSSQSYTMRARLYHRPLSVPPRAIAGDTTFPRSRRRRRRRSTLDGIGRSNSRCKTHCARGFYFLFYR